MLTAKLKLISCASVFVLATFCTAQACAAAQDETTVIVTGTRTSGLKASDSATPVQVVGSATLKSVGQTDLAQGLAQSVPAFAVQGFGSDMANQTLSTRLRGLSPNDTLVLIDGKRRHGSASLAVLQSAYQGSAAPDLSFIPEGAIDHVEVLTDGAAAQYGTDAIAGVVNIILKKDKSGGTITATAGQYFDGGGKTADISANLGFAPTDRSFLDLTYESKYHGYSDRGAPDPRAIPNSSGTFDDAASWIGGTYDKSVPDFPHVNHIEGDSAVHLNVLSYNGGYDLSDDWSLYSFGTYGSKLAASYENWRTPTRVSQTIGGATTYPFPLGFNPHEAINEEDQSYTAGIKGKFAGWHVDLASTYGRDDQDLSNYDSFNVSLFADTGASPSAFRVGSFVSTQWTNTLDLNHDFDIGWAKPISVAFGIEQRRDTYQVKAGDAASRYKEGSQAFPGFSLTDAGKYHRDNEAAYLDIAATPVEHWSVDAAVREEHYTDFGDATVGQLTSRYDFTPQFAVRGTIGTGFRAPSLEEEHYSATNVTPTSAYVQLPPNAPASKLLGISPLRPEDSRNYSLGLVAHPIPKLTLTVDAYEIDIDNRIIASGTVYSSGSPSGNDYPQVTAAIAANGNVLDPTVSMTGINIFANGADTRTRGLEFVATLPSTDFHHLGQVDWSLSGDYSETKVTRILNASTVIASSDLFDRSAISTLEDAAPKYRVIAGATWTKAKWQVALKETLYGQSSTTVLGDDGVWYQSKIKPTAITDLSVTYKVSNAVKFSVGANNLLNTYPRRLNSGLLRSYIDANDNTAVAQYPAWSPFGFDGGYYYARLSVSF